MPEQNLSDWRTSGHLEWRRPAEASQTLRALAEEAVELQDITTLHRSFDQFALVLPRNATAWACNCSTPKPIP